MSNKQSDLFQMGVLKDAKFTAGMSEKDAEYLRELRENLSTISECLNRVGNTRLGSEIKQYANKLEYIANRTEDSAEAINKLIEHNVNK